jgi:hypothetical protein
MEVKKAACFFCLATSMMFLHSSGQAQSGPDATKSGANNDIPSSLVASLPSHPRAPAAPNRLPRSQQFACSVGITLEQCTQEMLVLRKALANYRASDLGEWTWVLVRSENWKLILLARGLNPGIPALTALDARTTFFEEALVAGPIGRVSELMDIWHLGRESLLDLAVRHELGHALCTEENERKADRVARLLEQRRPVACEGRRKTGNQQTGAEATSTIKIN